MDVDASPTNTLEIKASPHGIACINKLQVARKQGSPKFGKSLDLTNYDYRRTKHAPRNKPSNARRNWNPLGAR